MTISDSTRQRVRAQAKNRCGYCLSRQELVLSVLEIEHIIPSGAGGTDDEENLWLACRSCNLAKGMQTQALDPLTNQIAKLFDPRRQQWPEHFHWNESAEEILGRTLSGRATVMALNLNNSIARIVRRNWVKAGWHPPAEEE